MPTSKGPRRATKPKLLAGSNPQIPKGYGDTPGSAYIAAMPGWKSDMGRRLDTLIERNVPGRAQGREVELALLRHRGSGLVDPLPHFTSYVQVNFFAGTSCDPCLRGKADDALDQHPRGRAQRSTAEEVDQAGGCSPRLDHVGHPGVDAFPICVPRAVSR